MSEWQPIKHAIKDGRFYDTWNAYNGERRISRFVGPDEPGVFRNTLHPREGHWEGWSYNWGNAPSHCKPMPQPTPNNKGEE